MKKINSRKKQWIERTVANDRSYKRILYNRFFIFALFVLLQLIGSAVLLYFLVYNPSPLGFILQLSIFVLEIVFLLYLINKHERPSTKISWIIVILLAPVFGVPMYLMNGGKRPVHRMDNKIKKAQAEIDDKLQRRYGSIQIKQPASRMEGTSYYLETVAKYPAYYHGDMVYYKSGEDAFLDILNELKQAKAYILIEYFIIAHGKMWNEILKILLEKAMQGVKIRIIYDDFGCMVTLPPDYERYLESLHENIKCMTFNSIVPVFAVRMNNRDHRKILVIDGKVAFTGGFNLADEYINEKVRFGYWKDTGLKITGNSVRSFVQMFFYLWNAFRKDKEDILEYILPQEQLEQTDYCIQPYDDSPLDSKSTGEAVYLDMINQATSYVWIFTPYLILDDMMRMALCQASLRGVDVRIVTPAIPDKKTVFRLTRANYSVLWKAGVKIYEYTPGFIHAKSMLCDGKCGVVGTINLDYRSLYHHFENAVYFTHPKTLESLKKDCEETFSTSKLCVPENTKRGFFGRIFDAVLRVFETLL